MIHLNPLTKGLFAACLILVASTALSAQTADITTVSAVSSTPIIAPDSLASSWGANLSNQTAAAGSLPLPTTLGGLQLSVTDAADEQKPVSLYLVSPGQINFLVPGEAALGAGTIAITSGGAARNGDLLIPNVAPALISTNSMGTGTAAGQVVSVSGSSDPVIQQTVDSIAVSNAASNVYLMLYGTGIRNHSANPVQAMINGVKVPVLYAGAQSEFPGLDQINLGPLPRTLAASGAVNVELFVDGVPSNVVTVTFE